MKKPATRRQFIQQTGILACGAAALARPTVTLAQTGAKHQEKEKQD
ncbi:twin-arginine translocation signal domain-containing protein [Methylobacter sp.]